MNKTELNSEIQKLHDWIGSSEFIDKLTNKIENFHKELEKKITNTISERKKFTPPYDVEYGILSHKIEAYKEIFLMFQMKFILEFKND